MTGTPYQKRKLRRKSKLQDYIMELVSTRGFLHYPDEIKENEQLVREALADLIYSGKLRCESFSHPGRTS